VVDLARTIVVDVHIPFDTPEYEIHEIGKGNIILVPMGENGIAISVFNPDNHHITITRFLIDNSSFWIGLTDSSIEFVYFIREKESLYEVHLGLR
jgi:hypothetical protein